MGDNIVWVADFKLNKEQGNFISRCFVWNKESYKEPCGMDLEKFKDNPSELLKFDKIYVRNKYTSMFLNTKDIENIKLGTIKTSEW